jgi:hypothetical protein
MAWGVSAIALGCLLSFGDIDSPWIVLGMGAALGLTVLGVFWPAFLAHKVVRVPVGRLLLAQGALLAPAAAALVTAVSILAFSHC